MPSISVRGVSLHYERAGLGEETILFLHGLMLASESWRSQVEAMANTRQVVTFDLRGQGLSAKPETGLDLDSLAEDTAALIEALDIGPCHIVGFSMGAFIAMRVGARHPALVRSLTLIGPSAEAEDPANMGRYAMLIRLVRLFGPGLFAKPMLKVLFGDSYLKDPARQGEVAFWRRYVKALPRSLARAAAASAHRKAIADELSRITAPTLIVSGEEDRPVSPALARKVHAGITGSHFMPVAKTGHAVMIERPDLFNRMLAAFLASLKPGAPAFRSSEFDPRPIP